MKTADWPRGLPGGDGTTGEEITPQLQTIASIPLKLLGRQPPPFRGPGRGIHGERRIQGAQRETVVPGTASFCQTREMRRRAPCASLTRQITAARPLRFFAYGVPEPEAVNCTTQTELLEYLKKSGFPVCRHNSFCPTIEGRHRASAPAFQ